MGWTTPYIPGYAVKRKIADGGYSEVFLAEQNGKQYALKLLAPRLVNDRTAHKRMQYECEMAMKVARNKNVIDTYDVGEAGDRPYIVMEYFESRHLREVLRDERRAIPMDDAISYALQTAMGLTSIHEAGIVHMDMKPENVLVNDQGLAKIIDLGISVWEKWASLPWARRAEGSPSYMSPEQILQRPVTVRSDIYSLGCLLYELFCGRPPYIATSQAELLKLHVSPRSSPRPLREINPEVSTQMQDLILNCLKKHPEKRPPSVITIIIGLQRAGGKSARGGAVPQSPR